MSNIVTGVDSGVDNNKDSYVLYTKPIAHGSIDSKYSQNYGLLLWNSILFRWKGLGISHLTSIFDVQIDFPDYFLEHEILLILYLEIIGFNFKNHI